MCHLPKSIAIAVEIEGVTSVKSEKSKTVKPGGGDKPQEMERTESNEPGVKETLE